MFADGVWKKVNINDNKIERLSKLELPEKPFV